MKRRAYLASIATPPAVALAGCIAGACEPEYSWEADPQFGGMTSFTSATLLIEGSVTNEGGCTVGAARVTIAMVGDDGETLTEEETTLRDLSGGETREFTINMEVEQWMGESAADDPWEVDVETIE